MLLAPAHDVFPFVLLSVFGFAVEGRGRGEVNGSAVGRPGKGVHVEFFTVERKGFATGSRNEPQAVGFGCLIAISIKVGCGEKGAIGDEGDPFAVGTPLRLFFGAGVGQGTESGRARPKPEVVTIDIRFPVGGLGSNDCCRAIGREAGT